jgi:hypothetical protein
LSILAVRMDYLLANIAPPSLFRLILVSSDLKLNNDPVRHDQKKIDGQVFLCCHRFKGGSLLMMSELIVVLQLDESMPYLRKKLY